MKEAVTKVIDTLTQEDFHGAFQKFLVRYNNCIATGGDYFDGDKSFMCELSIKMPYEKSQETYRMYLVWLRVCWFGCYGISTFVGCLMPNLFLYLPSQLGL